MCKGLNKMPDTQMLRVLAFMTKLDMEISLNVFSVDFTEMNSDLSNLVYE